MQASRNKYSSIPRDEFLCLLKTDGNHATQHRTESDFWFKKKAQFNF